MVAPPSACLCNSSLFALHTQRRATWVCPRVPKRPVRRTPEQSISRLLRKLPGSSTTFGPPRRFTAETPGWVEEWNSRSGNARATCKIVHTPSNICRREPTTIYQPHTWQLRAWQQSCDKTSPHSESPATFFAAIPNARVFGADGCVIAPDDAVLGDVSVDINVVIDADARSNRVFQRSKLPVVSLLRGKAALLTSLGGHNYFHWMFHVLPRLVLMEQVGVDLAMIERFFVNEISAAFQVETLKTLGIETDRVIESHSDTHVQVDCLLLPSRPSRMSEMPKWACEFLREKFLPSEAAAAGYPNARERLYISRGKAAHRKVINEAEIEAYLHSLGFESVLLEALTVAEQASTLNSARVVVAPHGAGLTNLVFCRPDTIVIEMFSPSYINCCYWALSNWVGVQYYFLLGSGGRDREDLFALGEDIVVEVDVLEEVLKLAGLV